MKISPPKDNPKFDRILLDSNPGDCVEFETVPHSKHANGSIFLVLKVPTQYIKENERKTDGIYRVMIANIETGACSLMIHTRKIRFVDAEVINNELA